MRNKLQLLNQNGGTMHRLAKALGNPRRKPTGAVELVWRLRSR